MKPIFKVAAATAAVMLIFSGCSKLPETPPVTKEIGCTYIDPVSQTYPVPDNADEIPGYTHPVKYVSGAVEVECLINSYYTSGRSVANYHSIEFYKDAGDADASGTLKLLLKSIGSRKDDFEIAYVCYDANGEQTGPVRFTFASLEEAEEGELLVFPVTLMPNTARIEFHNYK
ncbi:MAG: hypothetical protein J6A60_08990 [Clostridia bacterium]|nr:hypothetical protein [Clostridia bacterium]